MANRLVITMKNFCHINSFLCAKQFVGPMRSLVTCLQGNFGFTKIKETYNETREKAEVLFQSVYAEAVSLANEFGIEEKWSESWGQQINWNITLEIVKEYWQRSVYLPFLDIAFVKMKPCSVKKRGHIMNYACSSSSMINIR